MTTDIAAAILAQTRHLARTRKQTHKGGSPKPPPAPSAIRPLAYNVVDAARMIGISRRSIYLKLASGELRGVKHGKLTLITDSELVRYIASLPQLDLSK